MARYVKVSPFYPCLNAFFLCYKKVFIVCVCVYFKHLIPYFFDIQATMPPTYSFIFILYLLIYCLFVFVKWACLHTPQTHCCFTLNVLRLGGVWLNNKLPWVCQIITKTKLLSYLFTLIRQNIQMKKHFLKQKTIHLHASLHVALSKKNKFKPFSFMNEPLCACSIKQRHKGSSSSV